MESDSNVLLVDVMAIADEADSQLAQAMTSYILEAEPMVRQSNHESGNAVIWSSDGLSNPNRAEVAAYRIMGPLRPVRYCTDDPAILTRQ